MKTQTLRSLALGGALALFSVVPAGAQPASFFDKYVALGDSLTAGVESQCLVERNQVNSYPAQLAHLFGVNDFQQPIVQEIALTNPPVGTTCLGAVFVPPATISVGPVSQMGSPLNLLLQRPYDNLGFPGAEVADLTQLTHSTSAQPSSALVLRNVTGSPLDGTSAVDQADLLLAPVQNNIVTLWIGSNDVLGAATSGIVVDGVTVTTVADFTASYGAILDAIGPVTSTMARANIPDVTAIPFTSTIPPVLVDPATRQPVLIDGHPVALLGQGDAANPCVPVAPDQGCPLPTGTLVTLPASALLAQGIGIPVAAGGTGQPLPHGFIDASGAHGGVTLYPDEVAFLQQRVVDYNQAIASFDPIIVVDIYSILNDVRAHGYHVGGLTLTSTYVTGGIFSYDGVHPSTIGYTLIADEFVKAINANAPGGAQIPRPDFSTALFTPNVPTPAGSVRGGGPWGYNFDIWRQVLSQTMPQSMAVFLPSLSPERSSGAGRTRVVGPRD
jgi:hypothetical protein